MRAIEVGHSVVGFDLDEERVKRLAAGEPQVGDIRPEQLAEALASGRYSPTNRIDDCAHFAVAVIAVPTPLREGAPDLSHIESAASSLAPHVRGSGDPRIDDVSGDRGDARTKVEVGSGLRGRHSPSGTARSASTPGTDVDAANTPKVVSGIDDRSLQAVRAFYETLVERTVVVAITKEAELTRCWRTPSGTSTWRS
jgi:UDP-N-acetyl-D-glucosamine dehydrogenase